VFPLNQSNITSKFLFIAIFVTADVTTGFHIHNIEI